MSARRAVIFGCAGPVLEDREAALFAEADPWGFILFKRNIVDRAQARRLTDALQEAVGWEAPILIDQEGGRVDRLGPPHWQSWLPPLDQMAAGAGAAEAMRLRYRIIAADLIEIGIDVNCAPVADVLQPGTHPILANRCYGADPVTVAGAARAVSDGLMAGGVLPVLKHLPGYGRAVTDSHLELAVNDAPRAALEAVDFAAFRPLTDLPLGMTAHAIYPTLDPDRPATVSPDLISLIRDDLGYGGLLMTDDISMQALSGTIPERSLAALAAGCDLALHCNGDFAEMAALAEALPPLTAAGQARSNRALAARRAPEPFDRREAEARLAALLGEVAHG